VGKECARNLPPIHQIDGTAARAFQLDVTEEENWRSVSLKSRDLGEVDIAVNN
jgi:hypothetical protein